MITQEYFISDLELRLTKAKPSNDTDLTQEQLAYWVDLARDYVTKQYVDESKSIDDSLVLRIDNLTPYEISNDVFVDLGVIPLDLKKNRGIVYVEDSTGRFLFNISSQSNKYLKSMTFTKPSSCTVAYTLNGSSIQISGGDSPTSPTYTVGIVHSELSRQKSIDERYYVAPSTLKAILDLAEEIGIRELNGNGFYDINQDGKGNRTT